MPTFMCFLNWTDQGAKAVKDGPKRYEATKALVTRLGGRLVCAYVRAFAPEEFGKLAAEAPAMT